MRACPCRGRVPPSFVSGAATVPVEELLGEAVLHVGCGRLLLDPALQQHLLVQLPLLLLLLQVLLHAQPLAVELLKLLRGVAQLRRGGSHQAVRLAFDPEGDSGDNETHVSLSHRVV